VTSSPALHGEAFQEKRVDERKDRRVGADAEPQGEDGDQREPGRFAEEAEGEAEVVEHGLNCS